MGLSLYKIMQNPHRVGWDTYSSAVVAAESQDEARRIHPSGREWIYKMNGYENVESDGWDYPENITVQYLGEATPGIERGVLCASFHAG